MTACAIEVAGVELHRGSAIRLRPRGPGRSLLDAALRGKSGTVEGIEQDWAGCVHIAVRLEDGRCLYFDPAEVEPV